ncbi:MAG: TPM domain-containing protein [Gammaproteobacteria bacterium]
MDLKRIFRHLNTSPRLLKRAFPQAALEAIEQLVRECEQNHLGEIRFAVEAALDTMPLLRGQSARERAIQVFAEIGVWDTEHNNGVLIYLLLADHDVEVVADRGIARHVANDEWERICREMEKAFAAGDYQSGALTGIRMVSALLERFFSAQGANPNELPDQPVLR